MSRHADPAGAMIGDYARAAAGLAPTLAILAFSRMGPVATAIIGGLAALFALFGVRTALRHLTPLESDQTGLVAAGPFPAQIRWAELDRLSLAYYSTRRDRKSGWMQLELRGGGAVIRLDSRIEGFARVVERAAQAAEARGLELSGATAANLEALGVSRPVFREIAGMAGGRA